MIAELSIDLDQSITRRFATLADDARVTQTAALEANDMSVLRATDASDAKSSSMCSSPGAVG